VAMTPEREIKMLRKEMEKLTGFVKSYVVLIDDAMKQPDSIERGRRIADLSNKLEFKNDSVRRFVLELDWNGKPLRRKPYTKQTT